MPKDVQFVEQPAGANTNGSGPVNNGKYVVKERDDFYIALERAESLVKGESSRAKVLIYTAAIERTLQEVLRQYLVPSNQKEDFLLNVVAFNFESQIDLAFRVGIISHNLWRDLNIIREMRDDCHARIENFSFEHIAIRSSVNMLERNIGKQAFVGLPVLRMDTEDKYSFIARMFLVSLEGLKNPSKRLNETTRERLYKEE